MQVSPIVFGVPFFASLLPFLPILIPHRLPQRAFRFG
jgi:hypothetical protein